MHGSYSCLLHVWLYLLSYPVHADVYSFTYSYIARVLKLSEVCLQVTLYDNPYSGILAYS